MPIYGLPFKDDQLFEFVNLVLPGWLVLALAPRWGPSQTISAVAALLQSALYVALVISLMALPEKLDYSDMFTYEGLTRVLSKQSAVLPCWVHYATFDLWVGRWIAGDSVKRGVPHLLLIPCLFATMFAGPSGLLLYFLVRMPFNKGAAAATKNKSA
ncbi:hypothetical protein PLESTB_001156400 [Pleodorina starrii]|uniref:DUF4281 domain-containing protein n=1 Tax=Pleodorina starrii TaxID=330485 RepID=A0A9W6BR58_9CHLO|nr:hypothetical protein PLESTM_001779500 [Pleodorina starrii]GLC56854.1 hypothetical protein PLESTB_001156400 [Pleodorina starrii]GLC68189.1 hypothetical protein PLESTF_000658200 [Pleodorina starrii]